MVASGLLLGALLTGCTAQLKDDVTGPPEIPAPTGVARAAFLADVNLRNGRIVITAPTLGGGLGLSPAETSVDWSLVGGDVVALSTTNFAASTVGAFTPGKVRVTFDVAITSRLDNVRLAAPTVFPEPPPGTSGPLLFPYDIAVAVTTGGTTTGGQGTDVIVVHPSVGLVAPSTDWDGAPWSFFNDASCPGDDCFRFEEYPSIDPGATTIVRRVGFDLDPTVGQFTARLIVAADLQDAGPPSTGTIQGSVTSPTLGPIAGVTVSVSPGGQSALTDASGSFVLSGIASGMVSLTFAGLPSSCASQPSYPATVTAGVITAFPLVLTCSRPSFIGTVHGTITRSSGGPAAAVVLTLTPTGGTPETSVSSDALGAYTILGVDVRDGTGAVALTNLPTGCTDPGLIPYSGLITGEDLQLDVVLPCGP